MGFRAGIALLLILSACATPAPKVKEPRVRSLRQANLRKAAALPWKDGGRCVVREAFQPWPQVVERCFQALDHEKVRFRDTTGRCAVASTGEAAVGIGICILVAPEIAVGAVIIIGAVVVAVAIKEALDAYEPEGSRVAEVGPEPEAGPASEEPLAKRRPEPSGPDLLPPVPPELQGSERRPDCTPRPVQHLGGNELHNQCADRVPGNDFPGWDVLVNGKNFDALQLRARILWEVKTNAIETYSPFIQRTELDKQVKEAQRERAIAAACGYDFVIGVHSEAHKKLLESRDSTLKVVVMDWC